MIEAKHTPGPWRIEGRRGSGFIISAGLNTQRDGPADYVGVLDPMFSAVTERDAHLIAAAPDLLEALRGMVDRYGYDGTAEDQRYEREARAAIAKAEGRT